MEQQLTAGQKLALQKEKLGTSTDVQKALQQTSWFVFDGEGGIQYKGLDKPDMRRYKGSKAIELQKEEYAFVDEKGNSIGQFNIEIDEHEVARIVPKPVEKPTLKSDRDFLYEIPEQIKNDKVFNINICDAVNEWIIDIADPSKHNTNLFFYITAPSDPHILLEKVVVKLSDIQTGTVTLPKTTEVSEFSIYTHKILDKYVRS
jgi:hypothetical protein